METLVETSAIRSSPALLASLRTATEPTSAPPSAPPRRHLVFLLGEHQFALPVDVIAEVAPREPIDAASGSPAWLLGRATVRATRLPVIDLQRFLEMAGSPDSPARHFVVVRHSSNDPPRAFLVREVNALHTIEPADVACPPALRTSPAAPFVRGLVAFRGRPLYILVPDALTLALADLP